MSLEALLLDISALFHFIVAILSIIAVLSRTRIWRIPPFLLNLDWLVAVIQIMLTSAGIDFLLEVWASHTYPSVLTTGANGKISGGFGSPTAGLARGLFVEKLFSDIGWSRKNPVVVKSGKKHCIKRQWQKPVKEKSGYQEFVYGLVNTGNSCFLNSVLQALSSLDALQPFLQGLLLASESLAPTSLNKNFGLIRSTKTLALPVTEALLGTLTTLSAPLTRRSSMRPTHIVAALSSNKRVINREQQDAQEFFQMISSAITGETAQVEQFDRKGQVKGLLDLEVVKGLLLDEKQGVRKPNVVKPVSSVFPLHPSAPVSPLSSFCTAATSNVTQSLRYRNPLMGMLASRLSCMECGYTEAIRHFTFDNLQLNLPSSYSCTLEETLTYYTRIEQLDDVICRRCSLQATLDRIKSEMRVLQANMMAEKDLKRKRDLVRDIVEWERRKREVERRSKGNIEEELDNDIKLTKPMRRDSTKQVMLAKPPPILCLHISRSTFHSSGATFKNGCRVIFPEYLDVTPYCTTGNLSTRPKVPISGADGPPTFDANLSVEEAQVQPSRTRYIYKLMSSVVHFGSHSFGHYIAYRRRPKSIGIDACACESCVSEKARETMEGIDGGDGFALDNQKDDDGEGWFRVSDEKVEPCGIQDVLRANPFMLMYERVPEEDVDMVMAKIKSERVEQVRSTQAHRAERQASFWGRSKVATDSEESDDDQESEYDDSSSSESEDEIVIRTPLPIPFASPRPGLSMVPTIYYGTTSPEAAEAQRIANILLDRDLRTGNGAAVVVEDLDNSVESALVGEVVGEEPTILDEDINLHPAFRTEDTVVPIGSDASAFKPKSTDMSFWGRSKVATESEESDDDQESEYDDLPSSESEEDEIVLRTLLPIPFASPRPRLSMAPAMYYGTTSPEVAEAQRIANMLLDEDLRAGNGVAVVVENLDNSVESALVGEVVGEEPTILGEDINLHPASRTEDTITPTGSDASALKPMPTDINATLPLSIQPPIFTATSAALFTPANTSLGSASSLPTTTKPPGPIPDSKPLPPFLAPTSISHTSIEEEEGEKLAVDTPSLTTVTTRGKRKQQPPRRREREGSVGAVGPVTTATVVTVN